MTTRPPAPQPDHLTPGVRPPLPRFRSLWDSAPDYQPDPELLPAVDAALALGAPLLITGQPGTGKTQVAYHLAWRYAVPADRLYRLDVRSTTTAEDLTARLDTVAYFHAAHFRQSEGRDAAHLDPARYYIRGPLYRAWREAAGPCLVLIDEIDKAPRDFPNDLLNVLDQHRFVVPETQEEVRPPPDALPPLVIITSNIERQLPEPFLRRCVYHHIRFDERRLRAAIAAHARHLAIDGALIEAAIDRFLDLRREEADKLNKLPSTGELLMWIVALRRQGITAPGLRDCTTAALPALAALIKDDRDLRHLRGTDD